jgi:hypothetical protein
VFVPRCLPFDFDTPSLHQRIYKAIVFRYRRTCLVCIDGKKEKYGWGGSGFGCYICAGGSTHVRINLKFLEFIEDYFLLGGITRPIAAVTGLVFLLLLLPVVVSNTLTIFICFFSSLHQKRPRK